MNNLIDDLSVLTSIPADKLQKLVDKSEYLIVDALAEGSSNNVVDIDIGIGNLQLIDSKVLEYRFIPSKSLEKSINKYLETGYNPLQDTLEKTLVTRIINVYKDII